MLIGTVLVIFMKFGRPLITDKLYEMERLTCSNQYFVVAFQLVTPTSQNYDGGKG